jgi:hypothetical protein
MGFREKALGWLVVVDHDVNRVQLSGLGSVPYEHAAGERALEGRETEQVLAVSL